MLSGNVSVCRDKDDNFVIETAIKGQAQYIVTRDDDIKFDKTVASFLGRYDIAINSIAKFLSRIQKA
jgi:predicted nucleic acid-binding protein